MKTRIKTSVVGILVLFAVMALFQTPVFEALVAIVALIALHEIYKAVNLGKAGKMVFAGFVPFTFLIMYSGMAWASALLLPLSFAFVLYLACCVILHSQTIDIGKLGAMALFGGMVMFCFYSFVYLKHSLPLEEYGDDALYFIFLILGFAWGGDSAAYFAGRFFGRHKLAPVVSPNKTVEGAVGGILGSVLLGLIITAIYDVIAGHLAVEDFTAYHYLLICILAAVSSVLGILGDLFASAVKRQCGIKDYGTIFPGHGGVMDRFDSVMFIAPFLTIGVTMAFYLR